MKKKLIALILSAAMCVSLAMPAFATPVGNFSDTSDTAWYADSVKYATEHNLFSGTSSTTFSPNGTMTRGMFVTVLSKMSGVVNDRIQDNKVFSDVNFNDYFGPCVVWAYENGIVSGTSDTTFSPNVSITREEIAVMLQKYLNNLGVQVTENENTVSAFNDSAKVSSWAVSAVDAMRRWGFVSGDEKGNYNPKAKITRAEAASILTRVNYYLETGDKYVALSGDATEEGGEAEPEDIALNKTSATVRVGNSLCLVATVLPENAKDKTVTWTSSNPSVATVDSEGIVTGVTPGSVRITAAISNGKTAVCNITVEKIVPQGITVTSRTVTMNIDQTYTLSAFVAPSAANQAVTFSSDDNSVASIDSNGVITAHTLGEAKITVKSADTDSSVQTVVVVKVTTSQEDKPENETPGNTAKTFECTSPSVNLTTSAHGWDDYYDGVIYQLTFNDFELGLENVEYNGFYWQDMGVHYSFQSSDTSVIKVNENGGLYDPIRLYPGDAPRSAIISVTKDGDGTIQIPVTISPDGTWYTVNDDYINTFTKKVAEYTNELRNQAGLSTLKFMDGATPLANYRCNELANNFSHTRPDGAPALDYTDTDGVVINLGQENIEFIGINYENGGTNISPDALAKQAVTNWYNSPGHREVMMTASNTRMAVGLAIVSTGDPYGISDGCAYMVSCFTGK